MKLAVYLEYFWSNVSPLESGFFNRVDSTDTEAITFT